MHVLINALHNTTGAGIAYLNKVIPTLAKQGWQVTLLCQEHVQDKILAPDTFTIRTVKPMGFWYSHVYEQLLLPFFSRKWKVDATWCNANYVPLLGKRPILTIHNNPQVGRQSQSLKVKIYWLVLKILTYLSYLRCRKIVTVANYLLPMYGIKEGLKNILAAPGADAIVVKDQPRDPNLIVAVGDVYIQKNYPLLIEALAQLKKDTPTIKLKMIGRVVDETEGQRIKQLVKKYKLEDSVELPEPLPHDETLQWVAQAKIAAVPSTVESYSMVVIEAMGCGTPVVAADVPCQREVAGNAAVFVPLTGENDAAAYGMALYCLLTDDKAWEIFHTRGKQQVSRHTWQKTGDAIVEAIKSSF
ncbi:MAG: glycosyltransferase [Alphaproteobacteria bacterium]|nr:glycosyltransferase [Alphaproteobacteria bacterium]MDD9920001.1 glycosyltransferase [Alphaproteobacteria bacterium]